ncbi:MAG TPA: UDP-N-acetylmuramoyl-L-alanine--D-glutamate ligase [Solirubrobacteraceae bacterium]|nr:UDP-N-acetylmuramoyl-L-alanine--D-glutamate ligase [Solirubrobacteraceae bacterium]
MRFSELDGAHVGVWGAGREIRSLAGQLRARLPRAQIAVIAHDGDAAPDLGGQLGFPEARLAGPGEQADALMRCEIVVRSPGVSAHRAELVAVRQAGVPVTTATALWLAERGSADVVGVTGTKGKSTTAALLAHLLRARGHETLLAGNIGAPALDLLDADASATAVVELSSFQIADLDVGPRIAVVTNVYREHLDWHGSLDRYRADKLRLLDLPGVEQCVLNHRDEVLRGLVPASAARRWFGAPDGWDAREDGALLLGGELQLAAGELRLRGVHNALNACAALTAVEALGIRPAPARELAGFEALAHRLQTVAERDGVTWVDDSISTTPESTLAALASFAAAPVILLAGGQDRDQDYGALAHELARRASLEHARATLVAMPSTGPRLLAQALAAGMPASGAIESAGLPDAVAHARALAEPGSVVLLSPAAPSFDRFRDFEQRGERFAELACA